MKKLILLLAGICMAFPAFHGTKWKGHFFAGYTKNLGTADVLVSATEYGMGLDIDQFSLPISLSPTICPIGKSVWNICRRQLGMVIRTKPLARPSIRIVSRTIEYWDL